MTITALPEATVQLLGPSQALTTPTSLVKELIDNALDAKATTVDILISTNTIDKIEVRDNGHGIPLEDLDALGRHGHTSKLRSFHELKLIGGLSLGFRGEALASATQLGEVTVTTKTEGQPAATVARLKPSGGVASQSRSSNPIGTTVTVTNFLSKIPVRKQKALKEASKMLSKLKDLLQAYCLARPRVRFTLKVMKSSKGSWSYAPRSNDGIKEAVSLVIGRDTASQCMEKSLVFSENGSKDDVEGGQDTTELDVYELGPEDGTHQFAIDMFLLRPDADISKIGHGQYISIDSRPVSHDKGTMRKIVTLFKSYFKDCLADSSEKLKNPFLWMDIRCPVASYDANVEPAKDDVLFCNEPLLLEAIEQAFKDFYGERKEPIKPASAQKSIDHADNIELLEARVSTLRSGGNDESQPSLPEIEIEPGFQDMTPTRNRTSGAEEEPADAIFSVEDPGGSSKKTWTVDMSEDYNEEIERLHKRNDRPRLPDTPQGSNAASRSAVGNSLNPWLIAKMTAPLQRNDRGIPNSLNTPSRRAEHPHTFLPTPLQSSPLSAEPEILRPSTNLIRPRQIFRADDITSLALPIVQDAFLQGPSARQTSDDLEDDLLLGDDSTTFKRRHDFISARQLPDDPSIFPGPAQPGPFKKLKGVKRGNLPFVLPTKFREMADAQDGLRQSKLTLGSRSTRTVENPQELPEDCDLTWAMDFEQRKEDATRQRREQMRIARLQAKFQQAEEDAKLYGGPEEITRNSPHKNRYNAAIATLEAEHESSRSNVPIKEPFKTSLPDGDPRAYLMKRKRSMSVRLGEPPKMTRAKTLKLPLERIPVNENLHSLLYPVQSDIAVLRRITANLKQTDMYIQRGVVGSGLMLDGVEKDEITRKVQAVCENWSGWKGDMSEENVEGGGVQILVSG